MFCTILLRAWASLFTPPRLNALQDSFTSNVPQRALRQYQRGFFKLEDTYKVSGSRLFSPFFLRTIHQNFKMILLRFLSCFLTFQVAFSSNQAAPTQQEDLKSKSQSAKTPTPSQEQTSEIRASDPLPSLPQSSSHHTLRIDPSSDAHSSSDSHPKEDHSYTLKDWLFNLLRKLGTSIPAWIHSTTEKIIAINYEDLPEDIKTWIKENPKQTAFYVFQGVVFFAPGLLSAPLLRLLGFTPKGPVGK